MKKKETLTMKDQFINEVQDKPLAIPTLTFVLGITIGMVIGLGIALIWG